MRKFNYFLTDLILAHFKINATFQITLSISAKISLGIGSFWGLTPGYRQTLIIFSL